MNHDKRIAITNIPAISAIYFALLQCGYDYYSFERDAEHVNTVKSFYQPNISSFFFSLARQNTCDVYPYWPRAAMLETASFHLRPDMTDFADFETYQKLVMSAGNISDVERNQSFWEWIDFFPGELKKILLSDNFRNYMDWENQWIKQQNIIHKDELLILQNCLDFCVKSYHSPVKNVKLVLSPIKCAYSNDYHMVGDCFIFSSGVFKVESVIHEFLHHVVHPVVLENRDMIVASKRRYAGIDLSYYLSGEDDGQLNAFEEFLVRSLTKTFIDKTPHADLDVYINSFLILES